MTTPPAATRPACAACKHQRRRCSPDCLLAPYFPADNQIVFENVHKLFGFNYVSKLIETTPDNLKEDAVKSIIYEANIRAANPVGGCYTVISELQHTINCYLSELDVVRKQLAFCRAQVLQVNHALMQQPFLNDTPGMHQFLDEFRRNDEVKDGDGRNPH